MKTYKAGDLVRVNGAAFTGPHHDGVIRHHIKAGAVCSVTSVGDGVVSIQGPLRKDCREGNEHVNTCVGEPIYQSVRVGQVKLAKQAMNKRAAYAARRGGPFEISSAIVRMDMAQVEARAASQWAHP